jgi:probable phosphoglycerate mutase
VDGPADPPLHERGRAQAERVAQWLADERLDALYASPMRRAIETADAISRLHNLPVLIDDELAEFDREATSYIPVEEMRRNRDPRLQAWANDDFSDQGGDPVAFRATCSAAVERVIEANPGAKVAVVCHGGVVNAYIGHVAETPRLFTFDVSYTGISRVAASRTGVRTITAVNETAHLRGTGLLLS